MKNEFLGLFTQALQTYTLYLLEKKRIVRPLSFNSINKRKSVRKMPLSNLLYLRSHSHSLEILDLFFVVDMSCAKRHL